MPDFHVRYTPYALSKDVDGFARLFPTYAAYEEDKGRGDQASLHYHIYITVDAVRKTVVNKLVAHFNIPTGLRGQTNTYYMVKEIDQPRFQLGYIAKAGKQICSNIDPLKIKEAFDFYTSEKAKIKPPPLPSSIETPERSEGADSYKCTLDDLYIEFKTVMKQHIRGLDYQIDMTFIKRKSRAFWFEKSVSGLQPVATTTNRFCASFYYEYLKRIQVQDDDITDSQFKNVGY